MSTSESVRLVPQYRSQAPALAERSRRPLNALSERQLATYNFALAFNNNICFQAPVSIRRPRRLRVGSNLLLTRNLQLCRVYALRHVSSDPENDGSRLLWYKRVKGAACSFLLYGAFTRRCSVLDARWGHSASSDRIEPLPLPSS
eukprot:365715-Chlamydomonas_euryale.AAC.9